MHVGSIIDIIMLAVFLMVSIVSFYIAYSFGLLPIKWVTIAAAILDILLILLLLAFKDTDLGLSHQAAVSDSACRNCWHLRLFHGEIPYNHQQNE